MGGQYEARNLSNRPDIRPRESVDPDVVREIAESILEVGQQTPILVRPDGDRYVLVEGLHRVEACKALGEEAIIGFVVSAHASTETVKSPYETDLESVRQKTERLRQTRLAKEAAERAKVRIENPITPGSREEKPSRNKAEAPLRRTKAPSLIKWLADREDYGLRK